MKMTKTKIMQFNRMRRTLIRISRLYATPTQMKSGKRGYAIGLSEEEEIEAAYENIQHEAKVAVGGVREIKDINS